MDKVVNFVKKLVPRKERRGNDEELERNVEEEIARNLWVSAAVHV